MIRNSYHKGRRFIELVRVFFHGLFSAENKAFLISVFERETKMKFHFDIINELVLLTSLTLWHKNDDWYIVIKFVSVSSYAKAMKYVWINWKAIIRREI